MPPVTLRRTSFARALSPASDGKRNSPLEGGGENRGNEVPAVSWGLFGAVQCWGREDMVEGEGGPGKGRGRGAGWVGMSWSLSTSSILYNPSSIIDHRSSMIDHHRRSTHYPASSIYHHRLMVEHRTSTIGGRSPSSVDPSTIIDARPTIIDQLRSPNIIDRRRSLNAIARSIIGHRLPIIIEP